MKNTIFDRGFDIVKNKSVVMVATKSFIAFFPKTEFFNFLKEFEYILDVDHLLQTVTIESDVDEDGFTIQTFEEFIFDTDEFVFFRIVINALLHKKQIDIIELRLFAVRQGFNSILIRGNRKLGEWSKAKTNKIESQKFVNFIQLDPVSLLIRSNKRISKANFDRVVKICNS